MEEFSLIQLLKHDELKLEEIVIWEYLVKWGIENTNSILDDDITKWSSLDFINLEKTIHNCIPHIRFFQMSSNDYTKVRTKFNDILPNDLDEEILEYFSNPNFKTTFSKLPSRFLFDSNIINCKDAALIASWIDKKRGTPYKFKDIPFKFKLIYRANQEGFEINKFHENCDNKGPTVVIIKVRDSGEIIGGYNPLEWRSFKIVEDERSSLLYHNYKFYNNHQYKLSNSFIFSLKNQILSRVKSKNEAITWCKNKGPYFGLQDLFIYSLNGNVVGKSKQHSYRKKVINNETFEIEEYEVFQIIDDRYKSFIFQYIDRFLQFIERMFEKAIQFIKWIYKMLAYFLVLVFCAIFIVIFILVYLTVVQVIVYYFYQKTGTLGIMVSVIFVLFLLRIIL
jgi:hypothetical protein